MINSIRKKVSLLKNYKQFVSESNVSNPYVYDSLKFIELLEKTIEPSSFICTYVASAIKMLEGDNIKIYGFSTSENTDAKYFVEENGEDSDDGHHFAVMNNRYIIDPWVYDNFGRSVFDLQNTNDDNVIKYLYGDKSKWTDITSRVEPFEQMFPKTYENLIRST